MNDWPNVYISTHPIVQDRLTKIRDKNTSSEDFRTCMSQIATFLGVEATSHLKTNPHTVETPLEGVEGVRLASDSPLIIPILRAGLALSEGLHRLLPQADNGHIGLYRDEETKKPVEYLVRLPKNLKRPVFVTDPMLATGHSMIRTIEILIERGVALGDISLITLLCAPEGLKELRRFYPDLPVFTAAVDKYLNENAFIVPGLGDAGDRYFGTD